MRATAPAESPCGNKPNLRQTDTVDKKNTVFECILVSVPKRTKKLRNKKRLRYGITLHLDVGLSTT
jgi:hypothetical protein